MADKKTQKRPKRVKASDRILHGPSTVEEQAMHMSVAPFDRVAKEMDAKWGIDVLPELVSPEMAQKYGQALGKLNDAIAACDRDTVLKYVGVCIRGMQAMDKAATEAGMKPASDDVWCVEINGKAYGLVRDNRQWARLAKQMPGIELIGSREMALAIEVYKRSDTGKVLDAVGQNFPGAEILRFKTTSDSLEDDIPF